MREKRPNIGKKFTNQEDLNLLNQQVNCIQFISENSDNSAMNMLQALSAAKKFKKQIQKSQATTGLELFHPAIKFAHYFNGLLY